MNRVHGSAIDSMVRAMLKPREKLNTTHDTFDRAQDGAVALLDALLDDMLEKACGGQTPLEMFYLDCMTVIRTWADQNGFHVEHYSRSETLKEEEDGCKTGHDTLRDRRRA